MATFISAFILPVLLPGGNFALLNGLIAEDYIIGPEANINGRFTTFYNGKFPCFFGGLFSRLFSVISSACINFKRVLRGWITSSM